MKLPSVPGAVSGVRDRWRARGSSAAQDPTEPRPGRGDDGIPMPLPLQGVIELLVVAAVSLLLGALLLGAVWAAGGSDTLGAGGSLRLAGQVWLLSHGAPLSIQAVEGLSLAGGTVTLVPLGLTLIPFGLSVVAGRRIARACWRGQFLLPFAAGMVGYAVFGALVGLLSRTEEVSVDLAAAAFCPLVPVALGTLVGGWSVSRSLAAVLGADAASWLQRTSQYSRWAGSYVWAVIRAGFLAAVAAVAGGALLLAAALAWNWDAVIAVYQDLGTDPAGDTALTALQLGYLPNMVVWALAWATGAGFSLGAGTTTSPFQTALGPLPEVPVLAAVPTGDPWVFASGVLAIPVVAGLLAGWWFCREGENHLDDWMAIRLPLRWITFLLSTVLTVVFIAAVGAGLVSVLAWLSHGSLGIGRLTDVGPHAGPVFLWLGAELAVGAAVGYLLGPWLEHEGYRSRARATADDDAAPAPAHPHRSGTPTTDPLDPTGADEASEEPVDAPAATGARRWRLRGRGNRAQSTSQDHAASGAAGGEDADGSAGRAPAGSSEPRGRDPRQPVTATAPRELSATAGRSREEPPRAGRPTSGSTAVSRGSDTEDRPAVSAREEAKRRRAERRSAKRKAARLAAMDRENER
ncbi:cell division protein PerM [Kocuria rhizophila]|uniref:cell division protein PerM n=1 Tax=Kocuria rhizophila TaxID=72000 RepID=UPI001EF40C66|nr:DUF6350 family protein [Kocuria rhizophila]MCG7424549.1 DUF6350 family protein [Kocuria rhizophila]MCT1457936.1 DUF6350 family protein [Kocuria rhizophila]MCT1881352.1 DUF6350 family protein [Kocuria rhizophila]MCT2250646.1 DUF6350 family protein [Kocuria rhizophila]